MIVKIRAKFGELRSLMLGFGGDRVGAKRKERGVDELYNATDTIDEAEITAVLSGSCHMQGPAEERNLDTRKNMVR